ncbi:hypothetical protein J6590_069590 [Homalodisca vitripennis]|nr:hypothetical protein J6590_069590 [Homalodisca vitripennis]
MWRSAAGNYAFVALITDLIMVVDGEEAFKRSNILKKTPTRQQQTLSLDRMESKQGKKKGKGRAISTNGPLVGEGNPVAQASGQDRQSWEVGTRYPTTKLEIKKNTGDLQSLDTIISNLEEVSGDEEIGDHVIQPDACEAARCECLVPSASGENSRDNMFFFSRNAQVAAAAFIVMATIITKKQQKKRRKPRWWVNKKVSKSVRIWEQTPRRRAKFLTNDQAIF